MINVKSQNLKSKTGLLFLVLLMSSCFSAGIDKRGAVASYKDGKVNTVGGGYYKIGELPNTWKEKELKYRAVLFKNENDDATITVSSWCKGAYDDAPLEILSMQQLMGLEDLKTLEEKTVTLEDREALRVQSTGKMDGAPIYVRSYILKMNNCVFDFFYISSPEVKSSVLDFEDLVQGFVFGKGPRVL